MTRDGGTFVDLRVNDQSAALDAKIWPDAPAALTAAATIKRGDVVKLLFDVRSYKDALQLAVRKIRIADHSEPGLDLAALLGPAHAIVGDLDIRSLVFDIETVPGSELRQQPATIAQAVAKHAERNDSDEGKVMSLSPWLGRVISIAVGDADAEDGTHPTVMVVPPEPRTGPGGTAPQPTSYPEWMRPMSEADLLRSFWWLAARADRVISFNGMGFDVPFLIGRSLVHQIPLTVDLLHAPWQREPHLDLYKLLAPGGRSGPSSLDVVCFALGLMSPKGVMDGSMVAPTYQRGDIELIAEYNAGDVLATAAIYRRVKSLWLDALHGRSG